MGVALSLGLRRRVIAAIEAETSCLQAAARFGVVVATAIRWRAQIKREGNIAAKLKGGVRTLQRIEARGADPKERRGAPAAVPM